MVRKRKIPARNGNEWQQKQTRLDNNLNLSGLSDIPNVDSCADLLFKYCTDVTSDSFQSEIAKKSSTLLIGRQEAMLEVFIDCLVKQQGSVDKALLYVVAEMEFKHKLPVLVNNLIHRGANTFASDFHNCTPLHHAVRRGLKGVAAKLLENDAPPNARDKDNMLPLQIALKDKNDDMCALLLAYMPNELVRNLFVGDSAVSELSLHELLRSETSMQQTILSVLDCMIEPRSLGGLRVYYNILESDSSGRPPDSSLFDSHSKSPLQIIAKQGNKNIVYHDAVRLLVRRKWKAYAKRRFEYNSILYLFALFCITFSAIVSVMATDPTVYAGEIQVARAVTEVFSLIMVLMTLCTEINQLRRHKLEYFHDKFNYLDFSSTILLLTVPALRFTHNNAQWHVFAFGYLFWTIRILKYAAVFRQTGAYAQILGRALQHDFLQFGAVFLVILLAFSVSFFLSLKGDGDLDKHTETSTIWGILFVGIRSLTEAAPVVDYTGSDGYAPVSVIFMVSFLFTCIVILLNILIAQLTDTYQKVQQDAQRGLEVNRAWIVARVELNSILVCFKELRKENYVGYEDIIDVKDVLDRWESPPINEMNKYIRDIWDSLENHKMNLLTLQHRMARQENALRDIQDQLRCLITLHTVSPHLKNDKPTEVDPNTKPTFYSGDIHDDSNDDINKSEQIVGYGKEDIEINYQNGVRSVHNNIEGDDVKESGV
ncbi:hypothetical protein ACF0H5_007923 [Mactra antiquata]